MKLTKQQNKLIVEDADYFEPQATLECGQVFRYKKLGDQAYVIVSGDKRCMLYKKENTVTLETADTDYFLHYFDLERDYSEIVRELSVFKELVPAIEFGKGIRILRQDLFECIISFIISANNNIPRIQGIIGRICERAGEEKDGYFAFPNQSELAKIGKQEFRELGAGFRDTYLEENSKLLVPAFLDKLRVLGTEEVLKQLKTLKGVGDKVADCITLFGLGRLESYPVDVWIYKSQRTDELDTKEKVRAHFMKRYGRYAGIAQQYQFYYERSGRKLLEGKRPQ